MERFRTASVALAETASRGALERAGLPAAEVTHLVCVTCTGFENPGPDTDLADRLGLADGHFRRGSGVHHNARVTRCAETFLEVGISYEEWVGTHSD